MFLLPTRLGRPRPAFCLTSLLIAPLLFACGDKLEKNPVFQDQMRIVEGLDEHAKVISRQFNEIGMDVSTLKRDVNELRAAPQASTQYVKALEQRVLALEQDIDGTNKRMAAIQAQTAQRGKEVARAAPRSAPAKAIGPAPAKPTIQRSSSPKPGAAKTQAKAPAKTEAKRVASAPATKTTATSAVRNTTSPPKVVAKPAPTRTTARNRNQARGSWHYVKDGETFDSIAQANKIKTEKLLTANRIPAGRRLFAGQKLYVPAP